MGGIHGDESYIIHGAPTFSPNEKVVILANRVNGNLYIHNLGQGKYSLQEIEDKLIIVSTIIPDHPAFGKIPLLSSCRTIDDNDSGTPPEGR